MNDGLDGRETLAFGLAAGEVAVFVLALMSAYAVIRTRLAGRVPPAGGTAPLRDPRRHARAAPLHPGGRRRRLRG
jgi:hypothetical protein